MTVGGSILIHGEEWAATVDDLHTVRIIRDQMVMALDSHDSVANEIEDLETRAEFRKVFENDVARCEAVINTCNQRLGIS